MAEDGADLVTGATGFSASHLIQELLSRGRPVVATDLPAALEDPKRAELHRHVGVDREHPRLELVPSDLLDPASLEPLFDRPVRRVFHTASLYDYSAPLERLRRVNVEGTRNLLAHVRPRELDRFVHWSTCGVFGKPYTARHGRDKNNLPFAETSSSPKNTPEDAEGPRGTPLVNAYSVSKWEQEKMMWRAHREDGLPLTVVRPAPIYGPGSDYGHGGIILAIARGLVPAIPADARHYVTASVHVRDLARFAAFVAEREDAVGEDYNVVDDSVISYSEFLRYIGLLTGARIRTIPFVRNTWLRPLLVAVAWVWTELERRFGIRRPKVLEVQSATYMASSYWLSNRKSQATGFAYAYPDVREGLKDTIAWMREVRWL